MALRDDLEAATRAVGGAANQGLDGDASWSTVVPIEGSAVAPVQVVLATSGRSFSLRSPLADLDGPAPEVLLALLRRHADADHTAGAAYAVVDDGEVDVLLATASWVLPSVSADQLGELLGAFAVAVRAMRADLADLAAGGAPLHVLPGLDLAELVAQRSSP